jgi:hypothetical protein
MLRKFVIAKIEGSNFGNLGICGNSSGPAITHDHFAAFSKSAAAESMAAA